MPVHTKHSINISQGVLTTAHLSAYVTGCHPICVFLRKHVQTHKRSHWTGSPTDDC